MYYPDTPPAEKVGSTTPAVPTIDDFHKHALPNDVQHGGHSLPTPPPEPAALDEKESTPASIALHGFGSKPTSDSVTPIRSSVVGIIQVVDPPVTWVETFRFLIWSIMLVLNPAWRDLKSFSIYRPLLSTDFMTHYFVRPSFRQIPRGRRG
jgi:hypothetical protein